MRKHEQIRTIGRRIRDLRQQRGMSQKELADALGYSSRSTIAKIESGDNDISQSNIMAFANALQTTTAYLMGIEDLEGKPIKPKAVKIPVLGIVPAGVPIEAVQEVLDYEEITPEMARHGDFFALQIKGDSMAPELRDGDIVIIRQQPDISSGDIGVVMVNSEDATVKRVIKHDNGISIVPINPLYAPQYFSNEEIDSLPVRIIGAVVECRRKYQRI